MPAAAARRGRAVGAAAATLRLPVFECSRGCARQPATIACDEPWSPSLRDNGVCAEQQVDARAGGDAAELPARVEGARRARWSCITCASGKPPADPGDAVQCRTHRRASRCPHWGTSRMGAWPSCRPRSMVRCCSRRNASPRPVIDDHRRGAPRSSERRSR